MGHLGPDRRIAVALDELNAFAAAVLEAVRYLGGPPDPQEWAHALGLPLGSKVGPLTLRGRLDGEREHEARLALDGAAWSLVVGQRLMYQDGAWVPSLYAHAVVVPEAPIGRITLTWPGPGLAAFLHGHHGPGRRAGITALRSLDQYAAGPVVAVDASWAPDALRDAARAQLASWVLARAVADTPQDFVSSVTLSADALGWLQDWARRLVRRGDPVAAGDLLAVAQRALRAGSPAGHRAYWRARLSGDRGGIVRNALALLGGREVQPREGEPPAEAGEELRPGGQLVAFGPVLGRTAAYARLRRAGMRPDDFLTPEALARWLADHAPAPAKPPLAPQRRAIVEALVEKGWQREAARKLERRWRGLPPEEQQRRLVRLLARHGGDAP
jgi:hypothetical protein